MSRLEYNKENQQLYWNSLAWKLLNKYMLQKYGCCQKCGEKEPTKLVIHHFNYGNFPFDKEDDLMLLCKNCHYKIHQKEKEFNYTEYNPNKLMKVKKDIFDLSKITEDVVEKYSLCCDLCDRNSSVGDVIPTKDIILYKDNQIQLAYTNLQTNLNRKDITICYDCWEELNRTKPKVWDLSKNPQLAYALKSNPKDRLKKVKPKNIFKEIIEAKKREGILKENGNKSQKTL